MRTPSSGVGHVNQCPRLYLASSLGSVQDTDTQWSDPSQDQHFVWPALLIGHGETSSAQGDIEILSELEITVADWPAGRMSY